MISLNPVILGQSMNALSGVMFTSPLYYSLTIKWHVLQYLSP